MLPDTGERYLSTPLFDDIPADMTRRGARDLALDAELPLRRAAARARAAPAAAAAHGAGGIAEADEFVDARHRDREQPVVMFALEWCEFCWSVRKMFARYGIPYRSIDLDSVEYQKDDRGGQIRAALTARTAVSHDPAGLRRR